MARRIDSDSLKTQISIEKAVAGGSDAAGMTKALRLVSLARLMPAKPMAAVTSLTDPSPTR